MVAVVALGALDETRWVTDQPAMWVEGRPGQSGWSREGLAARLCHWVQRPEHQPYQVEVMVDLTDETVPWHYFWLRWWNTLWLLSEQQSVATHAFEGPSVYDWTILDQVRSSHYRKVIGITSESCIDQTRSTVTSTMFW